MRGDRGNRCSCFSFAGRVTNPKNRSCLRGLRGRTRSLAGRGIERRASSRRCTARACRRPIAACRHRLDCGKRNTRSYRDRTSSLGETRRAFPPSGSPDWPLARCDRSSTQHCRRGHADRHRLIRSGADLQDGEWSRCGELSTVPIRRFQPAARELPSGSLAESSHRVESHDRRPATTRQRPPWTRSRIPKRRKKEWRFVESIFCPKTRFPCRD